MEFDELEDNDKLCPMVLNKDKTYNAMVLITKLCLIFVEFY